MQKSEVEDITCYICILITAAKVTSVDDTNNKGIKKTRFFPLYL